MYIEGMFSMRYELYGESTFTSFRSFNGVIIDFEQHLKRLKDAVENYFALLFNDLDDFDRELGLSKKIVQLLEVNKDAYFRITIYADCDVSLKKFKFEKKDLKVAYRVCDIENIVNEELKLLTAFYPYSESYKAIKNGSYFPQLRLKKMAIDQGYDDVLFINPSDHILELSSSSLFFERFDGSFITPDAANILESTTLKSLAKVLDIKKESIKFSDLESFKSAYAVNAVHLITPISSINTKKFVIGDYNNFIQKLFIKNGICYE